MCRRKKVRWSMLLSHHPPSQYSRTYKVFGIRVCARCSGIILGILPCFIWDINSSWWFVLLLPLPTFINFLVQELHIIGSFNFLKTILTIPLGFYVYTLVRSFIEFDLIRSVLMVSYIVLIEFIVAIILRKYLRLDQLIFEYEEGIYIE